MTAWPHECGRGRGTAFVVTDARGPIAKRRTAGTDISAPVAGRIARATGDVGASADVASTEGAPLAARAANSSPDGTAADFTVVPSGRVRRCT